jgi:hypothetical protein
VDKGSCLGYDPLWLHSHYACNHKNFVMARRSFMTDDAISVVDKVENWPARVDFQKADFEIASPPSAHRNDTHFFIARNLDRGDEAISAVGKVKN